MSERDALRAAAEMQEAQKAARTQAPPEEPVQQFPLELFLSAKDFLALPLPPRETIIAGLLLEQSLVEIFGWRGNMKTWCALELAVAVATGARFLAWEVPKPRRVLYVDGEMSARDLQDRLRDVIGDKVPDLLTMVASELFGRTVGESLAINVLEQQQRLKLTLQALESLDRRPEVIIFDNLSTLTSGLDENDNAAQDDLLRFLKDLRHDGYTVIFLHHASKTGDQRGASRREDLLDLVIRLDRADSANPQWVTLSFGKVRGRPIEPQQVVMAITADEAGRYRLAQVTSAEAMRKRTEDDVPQQLHVLRYIDEHSGSCTRKTIADTFDLGKSTANEHVKKLINKNWVSGAAGSLRVTPSGHREVEKWFPGREM